MIAPTLFGCQFPQPALPGFGSLVYSPPRRHTLGHMGEVTIKQRLEAAGYVVRFGRRAEGDLHVTDRRTGETWRVEVKTAMRCTDRKWRFTLLKYGHTDYRHSDLVILLAVDDDFHYTAFTIPVADLGARSALVISSHPVRYNGWLVPYRVLPAADLLKGLSDV